MKLNSNYLGIFFIFNLYFNLYKIHLVIENNVQNALIFLIKG